jgi:hypothetical protein
MAPCLVRFGWRRFLGGGAIDCGGSGIEQPADKGELGLPLAVGQKPIMPDTLEAVGQHVQQETADELGGIERHAFLCCTVSVVPPAESDAAMFEGNQAAIGDRDPVGVAAQIGKHLPGASERRLSILPIIRALGLIFVTPIIRYIGKLPLSCARNTTKGNAIFVSLPKLARNG